MARMCMHGHGAIVPLRPVALWAPTLYPIPTPMSFLFDKRTKRVINAIWGVVAVIVAIGMVIFFAPGLVNLFLG